MTIGTVRPARLVEMSRRINALFGPTFIVFFAVVSFLGGSAQALERPNRELDTANAYKNAGIYMFTYGPNDLGLPVGFVAEFCSGVLVHERVFLTAAHCAQWNVDSVAPFLRMVVSFSRDNPRDPSTWIDITRHLVPPNWPGQHCQILAPYEPPPCFPGLIDGLTNVSDIGLAVLARPVTDITPATLPTVDMLSGALGERMTLVGYGCSADREFLRNYGTSTLASIVDQRAYYSFDPSVVCQGDSGGPTFFKDRVVSLHAAGPESGSTNNDARLDTPDVLSWVNEAINSLEPLAVDLNQHGLTGSWFKAVTSGQGVEVEVFANPTSGTGSTFVSWFTYDSVVGGAERQRWYTAQGPVVTGQPTAALTIYQNTGGNFDAPPVTTAQQVGTATLSFDTCTSGQLGYNFSDGTGRTGTIPLTRLTQNVTCSTTTPHPTNADFALSGNWFGGAATSGQGLTAEVNPISGAFFAAWYTYMPNGTAAGAAGQRWYTAQGAFSPGMRSIPVTIYETTGGMFDAVTTPAPVTVAVGTGTMAFQSCIAATLSYNFTGGTSMGLAGTLNLIRVGPVPPGCTM